MLNDGLPLVSEALASLADFNPTLYGLPAYTHQLCEYDRWQHKMQTTQMQAADA